MQQRPYGSVQRVCNARLHRFSAASCPIAETGSRPDAGINRLLFIFNGFAIPKPFCRTIKAYCKWGIDPLIWGTPE